MDLVPDGLLIGTDGCPRCRWAGSDPLYMAYHDREWGRPTTDERYLFEKLCLEGFQAGLSWLTILRKRENFRRAFAGFDPDRVAAFGPEDRARLMADPGIVRSNAKIDAALRRIDNGEFGYCEVSGEQISLKRLDARPIATMTLEAQEKHERREKVHRDD